MNHNEDKLLVVSPCTKRMGIAAFNRSELIYFAVITFKPPRTPENIKAQISKTIRAFIDEFAPNSLLIKMLGRHQATSKNLRLVASKVKRTADSAGIPLQEISFEAVKKQLCCGKKPTRANLFKSLCVIYPELKQFVNRPSKWQADYYNSLLSAVAVGFYHRNKAAQQDAGQN